jgi:hypothetical protein
MKNLIYIFALIFLISYSSYSQNQIAVQSGDTLSIYYNLDSAIIKASEGSTIYIPGGNFSISSNVVVDKPLHFYGVGIYPDSTIVSGKSVIDGRITFVTGSSNSSVTGIYFVKDYWQRNGIYIGTSGSNENVSNISINRCFIPKLSLGYNTPSIANNIIVSENIIRELYGSKAHSVIIIKNIINNEYYLSGSTQVSNNIFYNDGYPVHSTDSCTFNNNIFTSSSGFLDNSNSNRFFNNIFCWNSVFPNGTNLGANNIINKNKDSLFVNINDWNNWEMYFLNNYHLRSGCAGIGAGTDGYDIGIYGTAVPFKEGAVPIIPHLLQFFVPTESVNGTLPVNIKVEAQTK